MVVSQRDGWYVMREMGNEFVAYKPPAESPIHVQAFELGLPERGGEVHGFNSTVLRLAIGCNDRRK